MAIQAAGRVQHPGALDGSVYLYEEVDHALLALNAADGKERWKIENTRLSPGTDARTGNVSIQVVKGVVYARAANGVLSAFREEDGSPLWSHDFLSTFGAQSPWFIAQGTIYLSTPDGLFALRASDGQELWDYQGVYHPQVNLLAVTGANGIAYLLDYDPASQTSALLIARQASDGRQLWQRAMKQAGGILFADGALYIGYGGDHQTSGCTPSGPVMGAKLRPADGSQLWRFQSEP